MSERESFTNQRPFTVTDRDVVASWCGVPNGKNFRCAWCGYKFRIGDTARWVFTNNQGAVSGIHGNPFICASCDNGEDILGQLEKMAIEAKTKYWWFCRHKGKDR